MTAPTVLLSDLHLPPSPSPLREAFIAFVRGRARQAAAVYILGDLFEYWIGDAEGLSNYAAEAAALQELTASGVPVFYQHGNRDFMVHDQFFARTGVRLLPDPAMVELGGVPTVLSHGDLYCTGDVAYQRWRRFSRRPLPQWIYRRLPRVFRQRVANDLRTQSTYKPREIMDVAAPAIEAAFRRHGAPRLIHGHTHRPAEHRVSIDGREFVRIVLADWRPGHCEILEIGAAGPRRVRL